MTQRGINLGCGKVIMPCVQPDHHVLLPDALYAADSGIAWDNVDWNAEPGVNKVVDLFDYPWQGLGDNAYDVAIVSHLAEHIPHHIVWEGRFLHRHPDYQDGWFAFFGQLWRVLKDGGKAYVLSPHAFSNGGVSDPTHTRYLTPASFNYFNAPTNGSPFVYRMAQTWNVNLQEYAYMPHQEAQLIIKQRYALLDALRNILLMADGKPTDPAETDWQYFTNRLPMIYLNMMVEFCIEMTAVKHADHSQEYAAQRSAMGEPSQSMVSPVVAGSGAQSVVRSGAAG